MKRFTIYSTLFIAAISLLSACNTKQTTDQLLKDDIRRKEINTAIIQNPAYHMELMQMMMNTDSNKQMMGQNMVQDPGMMNMMMTNMMNMADKDSMMCKNMMEMMQQKPMMMKMMKKMNAGKMGDSTMKMY